MARFTPHAELRAIAFASLKAALTGSTLVASYVLFLYAQSPSAQVTTWIMGTLGIFILGMLIGSVFIGLTILVLGMPIAALLKRQIASAWGVAVALGCAFGAAFLIGLLFGNALAGLIILPYALPAGYFYRQEILLEDAIG